MVLEEMAVAVGGSMSYRVLRGIVMREATRSYIETIQCLVGIREKRNLTHRRSV